ncbi:MAG: NAD(P)-dependent oxidoreductase [Chloroflexi bacterium]|nr:NAD(P)-dependent oxidoreductase [Chloroflexota bacterium]
MSQMITPSVGFIGLGRMGKPMALNLIKAGHQLVVHSRSEGPVNELLKAGAAPAGYPGEVAALADVVFTCLPDEAASRSVYLGPSGLVEACRPTNLFIETSTVGPELARRIGAEVEAKRAGYIDAPISGGVERALDGGLTIMAGGTAEAIDRARPLLEVIGATVHHVGPVGQGEVVKLINQLLVAVHTEAACEAMVLAMKAGADPQQVLDVLSSSWGTSAMLTRTGPKVASGDYGSAAPTRLLAKDINLVAGVALENGLSLPLVERTRETIGRAMAGGLSETDVAALATLLT